MGKPKVVYVGRCFECGAKWSGLPDEAALDRVMLEHERSEHADPEPGPEERDAEVVGMAMTPTPPIELTHRVPYVLVDGNEHVGSVEFGRGDRFGRLSPEEIAVAQMLGDAASAYGRSRLPRDDNDVNEFCSRVHDLQARVMAEAARRAHPDAFPR